MPVNERGPLPFTELSADRCSACAAPLIGAPIPGSDAEDGRLRHYRREIYVETDDYDGARYAVCPDCGHAWPLFVGGGPMTELARRHVVEHNARMVSVRASEALVRDAVARQAASVDDALIACGLAAPLGWCYGPWHVGVRLYVPEPRSRDNADIDWHGSQERASQVLGFPVHLVVIVSRRPGMAVHLLATAEPWRDAELSWVAELEAGMTSVQLTSDEVDDRLRTGIEQTSAGRRRGR